MIYQGGFFSHVCKVHAMRMLHRIMKLYIGLTVD